MRLFISEATVSKLIDNAVQEAKVKWKENTRLAEIISGEVTDQKAVETITAELTAIIERITSDEGKAVTMELLKSVAELCGIDTSQFKKKADAVAACRATSSSGIQKPLSGFHAGEGLFSFMQENPRKIRRNNVGSKINSQNSQKSESGFDKKVSVGFQNFPIYFHP